MTTWNFICGWQRTSHSRYEHHGKGLRKGIRRSTVRGIIALGMLALSAHVHAAQDEQDESLPDLEFLEFLGQFETDSGEWIEPSSLMGEALTELLDITEAAETEEDSTQSGDAVINDQ